MRPVVTLLLVLASSAPLQAQSASLPEPPGQMVDIGGRRLHLHCSGEGSPTVVLVPGAGAYSFDWALVQMGIEPTTRVCSYDRAGLAWSDPGPADETVEQTTGDLHLLLRSAGEPAPFVLVGASIGGVFVRAFQHTYPEYVAALVFANSAHRLGKVVPGGGGLLWDLSEAQIRSAYPLPASVTRGPRPARTGEPFDRLPPELQAVRLAFDVRRWESWNRADAGPEADLSWRKELLRELDQSCSGAPEHPLGDLPVLVVSNDPSASELARQGKLDRPFCDRSDAADGLELLSSNSLYILAEESGHEVHLYQPELLVPALERVIRAVRSGLPLSDPAERR